MTPAPSSSPCRLVLVDRNPLDLDLLAAALDRAEGIEVVATTPTLVGHVAVAEAPVDTVLVRVSSPGFDLLAEVGLAVRHRDRPRVVVIAGYVDAYVVDRLLAAGVAAVASPDETLADVLGLVRSAEPWNPPARADRRELGLRHRITSRELEVLDHLADGVAPGQIARLLEVRVTTVRDHIKSLRAKLGCTSATQVVVTAHRMGLAPHVSRPLL